ncbi:M91 family zinc metallopeptidase [Undibacterium sp. TJN25]|uniref:M91 family zinc metallopeptidase n=1 Tax=Undibacterium sp. TJN25 TaxID=3413056 RepID=UPI003BF10B93
MAEIIAPLADYPGIACKYDTSANPFFVPIVREALGKIAESATGVKLLDLIAKASPRQRADFAPSINVMVVPEAMTFVQNGHKAVFFSGGGMKKNLVPSNDPRHQAPAEAPDGCQFYKLGGSKNAAKDANASTTQGQGSVCTMYFTNVEVMTSKGESARPYIVLAHELIHSYHCLYGIKKDGKDEELCTTGIEGFEDQDITENKIREELKIQKRIAYF